MTSHLKIYGERNTGSNYLEKLISMNLAVTLISGVPPNLLMTTRHFPIANQLQRDLWFSLGYGRNLGWKHSAVRDFEYLQRTKVFRNNDVSFVTVTKNPYSWLLSLYRRPYSQYFDKSLTFSRFLRTPWRCFRRDSAGSYLDNPIELWNRKNRSYLQLPDSKTVRLTYESLLAWPQQEIEKLSVELKIVKKSEFFTDYNSSTKKDAEKGANYYRDYYLNERWKSKLSSEDIEAINQSLDRQLLEIYGYKLI